MNCPPFSREIKHTGRCPRSREAINQGVGPRSREAINQGVCPLSRDYKTGNYDTVVVPARNKRAIGTKSVSDRQNADRISEIVFADSKTLG